MLASSFLRATMAEVHRALPLEHSVFRFKVAIECEFVLVDDALRLKKHIWMFSGSIAYRLRATTRKSSGRISTNIILVFSLLRLHHTTRDIIFFISNDMV